MPNRVCHLGLGRGPLGGPLGSPLGCPLGKSLFLKNIDFWKTKNCHLAMICSSLIIINFVFPDKYSIPGQCAGTSNVSQLCR